jgi:putative ABC transport system permease protein
MNSTFDLEKAIAAWRRSFEHNRVFSPEDLEELERHLRDHTVYLVSKGLSEEAAFERALQSVGDYGSTEAEYGKVFWEKAAHHHTFRHEITWRLAMLKNYLTIALRNLKRHKGYAFINVSGLAVGLACCILILLLVRDELSYDRFHEKADRIYRLGSEAEMFGAVRRSAAMPAMLGPALAEGRPEVEASVRTDTFGEALFIRGDARAYEDGLYYADSSVFDVFTFPLVAGNPQTALVEPFTIVLSESLARKYFGSDNPLGQTLQIGDDQMYRITGVMQDVPPQTHWQPTGLVSFETLRALGRSGLDDYGGYFRYANYLLLRPDANIKALEEEMPAFFAQRTGNIGVWAATATFFMEPLPDLYLHTTLDLGPEGSVASLYIFSAIALLILLIASVNYMNLATARSAMRAREVGVRKVVGAHRGQIVRQFLAESVGLGLAALLIALLLVELALPHFNRLMDKHTDLVYTQDALLLAGFVVLALVVGGISGSYPALFLSGLRPTQVLKGLAANTSSSLLRKGLVTFQFAVTAGLIACTMIIYQQLRFTQNTELGFNKEQVLVISPNYNSPATTQHDAIEAALRQRPGVLLTSSASSFPGPSRGQWMTSVQSVDGRDEEALGTIMVYPFYVDGDYAETLGLHIKMGRDFTPEQDEALPDGAPSAFILNEAAVAALGLEDPVGKEMSLLGDGRIVGVVENFHFQSMHEEIAPLVMLPMEDPEENATQIIVRFDAGRTGEVVRALEEIWPQFDPIYPLEYLFLDDAFAGMYATEQRLGRLFSAFAGLAILVACLGLFGLASFTAERRTKEIGIRKILGATVTSIVALLSKDFLKLVLIAFVIAAPLSYFAMNRWLEDFAYRIEIGPGIFLLAGALALLIALTTVSYQSIKAALANPVKSLRYE